MKLSIFTTITNPQLRADNYGDAARCYRELADELVVIDGSYEERETLISFWPNCEEKTIGHYWPKEFSWEFIGQQFQRGYEACTGDVVIHADLDFIFHENDFKRIRNMAQNMLDNNEPAVSFYKWQFVLPDRYNLKSRLVIMVNKRAFGDRIKFNSGGDLCQPSLDGKELSPNEVPESHIAFFNYEKLLKTQAQIAEDQGRMERAWKRHFGRYQMRSDGTDAGALERWIQTQEGKFTKPQKHIPLTDHPKFVQETIKKLKPEQFGYSGFGRLGDNDYVTY